MSSLVEIMTPQVTGPAIVTPFGVHGAYASGMQPGTRLDQEYFRTVLEYIKAAPVSFVEKRKMLDGLRALKSIARHTNRYLRSEEGRRAMDLYGMTIDDIMLGTAKLPDGAIAATVQGAYPYPVLVPHANAESYIRRMALGSGLSDEESADYAIRHELRHQVQDMPGKVTNNPTIDKPLVEAYNSYGLALEYADELAQASLEDKEKYTKFLHLSALHCSTNWALYKQAIGEKVKVNDVYRALLSKIGDQLSDDDRELLFEGTPLHKNPAPSLDRLVAADDYASADSSSAYRSSTARLM